MGKKIFRPLSAEEGKKKKEGRLDGLPLAGMREKKRGGGERLLASSGKNPGSGMSSVRKSRTSYYRHMVALGKRKERGGER